MKITTRKNYIAAIIVALTTDKDKYEDVLKEEPKDIASAEYAEWSKELHESFQMYYERGASQFA